MADMPLTADEAAARYWARYGAALLARAGIAEEVPDTIDGWIAVGRRTAQVLAGPVRTLDAAAPLLAQPFPIDVVRLKPGAVASDKKRALGLAYVDSRAYQDRLDTVVGPGNWATTYRRLSDRSIICRLTILGVSREDVGEAETGENQATEMVAQAFKRACAAFGLGRYLYELPKMWFDYDDARRAFRDERAAVAQLYALIGIGEA